MLNCRACHSKPITTRYARFCDVCRTLCSRCRKNPRAVSGRYCLACKAEAMREHRKRVPMSSDQRLKGICRSYAGVYLRRGKIERKPCEVCRSKQAQMYHEDYTKPLDVRWFCRKHHIERRQETR